MDKDTKAIAEARRNFTMVGSVDTGVSPAFIAAATAVGVGLEALGSRGLSVGGAVATAGSAVAAYIVADAVDASIVEATVIGGLSGTLGVIAGTEIDNRLSPPDSPSLDWLKDF